MNTHEIVADLKDVWKAYKKVWALQAISMQLKAGEIVGFIGPNGAGKTTLMKLMAGFSASNRGEVRICGELIQANRLCTPEGISVMMDQIQFIPNLSARQNLRLLSSLRQQVAPQEIDDWLSRVGLNPDDGRPVRAFSLGMRQRLGLAQALMEKPRLVLLDEPTNGLDPLGIIKLRTLLRDVADGGAALLIASHLLSELEHVCDRVVLVHRGKILKHISSTGERVELMLEDDESAVRLREWAARRLLPMETPSGPSSDNRKFLLDTQDPISSIVFDLCKHDIKISAIRRSRISLEEEFLAALQSGEIPGSVS